jgi:hypothetical protein
MEIGVRYAKKEYNKKIVLLILPVNYAIEKMLFLSNSAFIKFLKVPNQISCFNSFSIGPELPPLMLSR